ncbi:MAG: hypothetical protein ACRDF8_00760 [Chloroflexota bacterium]
MAKRSPVVEAPTPPEVQPMGRIQFQFVRARGLFAWAIARFGRVIPGYSHVDLVLPPDWCRRLDAKPGSLLGARDDDIKGIPAGVRVRPPNYEKWARRTVVTLSAPQPVVDAMLAYAVDQEGAKYDEDAIAGFIFGQRWHKNGDFICSAFATDVVVTGNLIHPPDVPPQQMSPDVLATVLTCAGGERETSHG